MTSYDPKKAAEVWKRVQSAAPPPAPTPGQLLTMIADELEDATTYLYLSRHFRGKAAAMLQAMSRQEQAHASYLKGIYAMLTGQRPQLHTAPAARIAPQLLLRQCYTRENQCHSRYQALCTHPEYGQVFSRFAAQELEHCQNLLLLLGNPKK